MTATIEPLMSTDEVSVLLRISRRTLEAWRLQNKGPPFVRVGRRVGYRPQAVESWLVEQTSSSRVAS